MIGFNMCYLFLQGIHFGLQVYINEYRGGQGIFL